MLVYGALDLAGSETGATMKGSKAIWGKAEAYACNLFQTVSGGLTCFLRFSLLSSVNSHLDQSPPLTAEVEEIEKLWNELRALLDVRLLSWHFLYLISPKTQSLLAEMPSGYLELRKAARTVRRSYHARTLLLISLCRDLADHFMSPGNSVAGKVLPLQK